jgi:hypothetical protein
VALVARDINLTNKADCIRVPWVLPRFCRKQTLPDTKKSWNFCDIYPLTKESEEGGTRSMTNTFE